MRVAFYKPLASMLTMALLVVTARADTEMENLKLFKGSSIQHGRWRVELLESSDASMKQMMDKMGKMSMCMDIAKQMAHENLHTDTNDCTHKVLQDSSSSAEIELSCESGSHIHSLINREGDKSYTADIHATSKDGKSRAMKLRYSYEGECQQGDAMMQMDKNSEMCKRMREKTKDIDMTALCARVPEQMRPQCEAHIKQVQESCQQL